MKVPPQIALLAIIARYGKPTLSELASAVSYLSKRYGIDFGYKFTDNNKAIGVPKELLADINTLRLLNLVEVVGDRVAVSEKGLEVLSRAAKADNTIREILGRDLTQNLHQR